MHRKLRDFGPARAASGVFFALAFALVLAACTGEQREPVRVEGPAQGTTYSVTVMNPPADLDEAGLKDAMGTVIARIDAQMSTWRDDSEIVRFNAAPSGEWVSVSPELAELSAQALAIGKETGGAFDVTLGPILKVWGFGADADAPSHLPTADELAAAREKTGIGLIDVRQDPPALRKRSPNVTLDLAGLAQGYTVDLMAARLDSLGAKRYLVELGGELYAKGNKRGRSPWRIGIEKPKAGTREIERVVGLANAGMTTSGDYRDYFELDGRRFSHTIDPRTGRPVAHDLRAVTVIAPDATTADAMATALLVMGPEAGLRYANEHQLAALFVSGEAPAYTESYSKAFEPYIEDSK
ncbi:ApbE family lipoprotein [Salinisphaera sp. T5B8]|uniref:FAD:protein FMN transferase n=1 Tax=unclassified Salinisphaera TaxID=2649847 RepID=UPI00333E3CF2